MGLVLSLVGDESASEKREKVTMRGKGRGEIRSEIGKVTEIAYIIYKVKNIFNKVLKINRY